MSVFTTRSTSRFRYEHASFLDYIANFDQTQNRRMEAPGEQARLQESSNVEDKELVHLWDFNISTDRVHFPRCLMDFGVLYEGL